MSETARPYCPGCEGDADSTKEMLEIKWCENHTPGMSGSEDILVDYRGYISGSAEAGSDGKAWCTVLHRDSPFRKKRKVRKQETPS